MATSSQVTSKDNEFAVLFTPILAQCVVERIVLPWSIVSLAEAMYQSAFLSLEFPLNSGGELCHEA